MYSFEIINSAIKNYDLLGKNNIIGTKRIKIITDTFDIHINTLYRWLKKYSDKNLDYNIKSKYNNKKITDEMELFIIKSKKQLIKTRFSISMTIDIDANINFTLKKGSMKQDDFIGLLTKLNKKYLKNKIIFLDNARIHKSKKAINYLEKNKINYIFNIPYHSHLNPIEYVFSLLRKKLLSSDVENEKDIIKVLVEFKKEIYN